MQENYSEIGIAPLHEFMHTDFKNTEYEIINFKFPGVK